ncbi:heptaprenyl diphosphate synthase component 1 [Brevibacillus massiliensis]|uniref:heptaprenyl diphosphate synthase component 1 n=1 Tax=Brevibacillus massiliensis TaxID=1118054 RepID=UPI0003149BF9|nr:heptaprenyl diphosphate synthase component 1 [Brevibacillus massiliensis]
MNRDVTPFSDEIREIAERIHHMISQPFVRQYVDMPAMAENRLALLYFCLLENGLEKERAKRLTISAGLMQVGLDTHELVKLTYESTILDERTRQLTVLAGDYCSSQYYYLLAEAGEIEPIRIFSHAIQQINEAKMQLHVSEKDNKLSWEAYLSLRQTIDTALYVGVVKHFTPIEEERRFWVSLFEETSAVERIIGEWEQLQWQKQIPSGLSRLLQKPGLTLANLLDFVEARTNELIGVCEQLVCSLYPNEKQPLLSWVTSRYSHRLNRLKRVVEEM